MSQQEISINKEKLKAFKEAKTQGKFLDFDRRVKLSGLWLFDYFATNHHLNCVLLLCMEDFDWES